MGIAQGRRSGVWTSDFVSGVAPCRVLAVNPTWAELRDLFGVEPPREPVYTGRNRNGTRYGTVRVYLETVPPAAGGEPVRVMLSMTVSDSTYALPGKAGVYCHIDPYGRLGWSANGRRDADGLRWCRVGEDNVTCFLRSYLDVPYPAGEVAERDAGRFLCRLENPRRIAQGDAGEVRDAVASMPDNLVNCMVGVRTSPEGHHRQCVFPRMFTPSRFLSQRAFEDALRRARSNSPFLRRDYYELGALHRIDPGRVWEHDALDHDAEDYVKSSPVYPADYFTGVCESPENF